MTLMVKLKLERERLKREISKVFGETELAARAGAKLLCLTTITVGRLSSNRYTTSFLNNNSNLRRDVMWGVGDGWR